MRHVRRLIRPGDTVVDIGGNIGFYALEMARLCAPGRLISFEPNPAAIDRFKGNWELNPGITNIQLLEHGLADKPGSFTLSFNRQNLGSASAYGTAPEHIEVRVDTLDNALAARGVERIDVLKIDIEGGELAALRGPKASWQQPAHDARDRNHRRPLQTSGLLRQGAVRLHRGQGIQRLPAQALAARVEARGRLRPRLLRQYHLPERLRELSPLRRAERSPRSRLWDPVPHRRSPCRPRE
ncbi:MAG: FkbM family methyltransferase [Flavobacteriales bacterium]|nr:FkbM family methyltransferase [Flavobacteriales bacterium]